MDALKHNDYDSAKQIYSQLLAARSSAAPTPLTKEAEMEALLERKRKLSAVQVEETPYANQEPPEGFEDDRLSTVSGGVSLVVKKKLPNLDSFLAQTTSEDNVSFDDLMSEARKKEALKTHHLWLHDKELQHQIVSVQPMMMAVVIFFQIFNPVAMVTETRRTAETGERRRRQGLDDL